MIMNPWPILGAWAARDNNDDDDDDDEDSAETRGHCAHGRGHEIQSIGSVSLYYYYLLLPLRENRIREGKERKKVKRGDVKFFREILFEVLINN